MIASGNHLLTQVKDNQPSLRRRLELGVAGRKPSGSAKTETAGRNRWETRELTVFPAKAWFRDTPWEKLIKTVLRLERTVCKRAPATGLCAQTTEVVFWISSASNRMPRRWNEWIRAHWRIENGSHYVRDTAFAEDASRIRKNPDIAARLRSFAYNLIRAAGKGAAMRKAASLFTGGGPGRDARLQRCDTAGGEVAAPEANRILAHAKRLRDLGAGLETSQSQQHGARPVRLPPTTGSGKSQKGRRVVSRSP